MAELNKIGILIVDESSKKFKLNPEDKRTITLSLIESDEYLRLMEEFEKGIKENSQ